MAQAPQSDLDQLIEDLGATSFIAREEACRQLLKAGVLAQQHLSAATRSSDREIRDRSIRLLDLIQEQRREIELVAFREGKDGSFIPGWKQFSTRYGSDNPARQVFSQILETEWALLSKCYPEEDEDEEDKQQAAGDEAGQGDEKKRQGAKRDSERNDFYATPIRLLVASRFSQIYRSGTGAQNYSLGTVLAFITLASDFPDEFALHAQLYGFLRHPLLQPMLGTIDRSEQQTEHKIIRQIVGDWLVIAGGPHLSDRWALQTTLLYRMHKEGNILAKRVLADANSKPMSISMAMQAIVIRDDDSQAELIEPFLTDTTLLSSHNKRTCELRDIALACLMQLNGHDVGKIGVKALPNATHSAFEFGTLGFVSEADREKALKIYRDLQAKKIKQQRAN